MLPITPAQQGVLNSGNQSEHIRVSIKDSGGTFRDLTTYPGFNAVKTVTWSERIDSPHMTLDVVLVRELFQRSLSPLVTGSALNKGFDPLGAYVPLVALAREVKVEVAVVPMDRLPGGGDWMEVFRGRVDDIDFGGPSDVRVGCRSLGGRLAQQYIKTELVYSFASVAGTSVALRVWEPQMAVTLNTYLLPASRGNGDPGQGKFLKCSQAGTTGVVEPLWTTAANQLDGSAKWDWIGAPATTGNPVQQVMQNILNDHKAAADPTVTLYVPTSPGWAIKQYIQRREFVLDAITTLAKQIGWDVRYKWRSGTGQFELTFYKPERTSPSVNYTFAAADYANPSRVSVNIADIRNAWRVVYSDSADLHPDLQPKRKVIEVSDAASIAKYGELWAEIQEDAASQIDTVTEATTLVNAALADCKEPDAEMTVPLVRGFPWVELNDYNTFAANGLHFSANQSLAVTGWTQTFDSGKLKTSLEVRGKPSVGTRRWIGTTVHPMNPVLVAPPLLQHFNGAATDTMTLNPNVGGFDIAVAQSADKSRANEMESEIHIQTFLPYTPDQYTLKTLSPGGASLKSISDLNPGTTYYVKTVPRSRSKGKVIRGQPSQASVVTAGRARTGHYDAGSTPGCLPLNGNFEHIAGNNPPDHWLPWTFPDDTLGGPTAWDPDRGFYYSDEAATKGNYIQLLYGSNDSERGGCQSSMFEMRRGIAEVNVYVSVRKDAHDTAADNSQLVVRLQGFSDFAGTNTVFTYDTNISGQSSSPNVPSVGVWYDLKWNVGGFTGGLPVPDNCNFMRVTMFRGHNVIDGYDGATQWDIGDIYVEGAGHFQTVCDYLLVQTAAGFHGTVSFGGGITQEAWGSLPLNAGGNWAAYGGSTYAQPQYMKDSQGFVRLRGLVKRTSGTNAVIATVSGAYSPATSRAVIFAVDSGTAHARVSVHPSGNIQYDGGGTITDYLSLSGIHYDTRS